MRLISTAVIYAWLYNSTNGGLLLVMVAHAGHNIATEMVRVPAEGANAVPAIIALAQEDGMAKEIWESFDMMEFLGQLGVLPSPGQSEQASPT